QVPAGERPSGPGGGATYHGEFPGKLPSYETAEPHGAWTDLRLARGEHRQRLSVTAGGGERLDQFPGTPAEYARWLQPDRCRRHRRPVRWRLLDPAIPQLSAKRAPLLL